MMNNNFIQAYICTYVHAGGYTSTFLVSLTNNVRLVVNTSCVFWNTASWKQEEIY